MSFFTLYGAGFLASLFTAPGTAQTDGASSSSIVGSTPYRRAQAKPFDKRLSVAETTHVSGPDGETAAAETRRAVETRRTMETR
jgi:hypothetical protein